MQISDFLYKKSSPAITFPPEPQDPSFFQDLKEHLQNNLDYRKDRIEWRKNQPANWDIWRVKEEFFQKFCVDDFPVFERDIQIFIKNDPGIPVEILAEKFCEKWKGYKNTYGVELVERAMRRCNQWTELQSKN